MEKRQEGRTQETKKVPAQRSWSGACCDRYPEVSEWEDPETGEIVRICAGCGAA